MVFYPHGSFTLDVRGDIIFVTFTGAWNLEQVENFFEAFKAFVLKQGFTRFGVLSDYTGLEGATPEAIAVYEAVSVWSKAQGQIARAQILGSDLGEYIVNQATKSKDLFSIQSFDNKRAALDWLAGLGLDVS